MLTYWIGRTLPVWLAPNVLWRDEADFNLGSSSQRREKAIAVFSNSSRTLTKINLQHRFWGDVSSFSRCEAAFLKTQTKRDPCGCSSVRFWEARFLASPLLPLLHRFHDHQ
jgi:hypothetical protein